MIWKLSWFMHFKQELVAFVSLTFVQITITHPPPTKLKYTRPPINSN